MAIRYLPRLFHSPYDTPDQFRHLSPALFETPPGQRGLKGQPEGGSIGLAISPCTVIRCRPDIARSGTAPSSIRVQGMRGF